MSSGRSAEPIQPLAPVTNTRMRTPPGNRLSPAQHRGDVGAMSAPVITVACDVIHCHPYNRSMTRWEPNARGRLEQAALELYAERGFDETTVAEIAERAGLTERTFFRHFPDKREVLFSGGALLTDL